MPGTYDPNSGQYNTGSAGAGNFVDPSELQRRLIAEANSSGGSASGQADTSQGSTEKTSDGGYNTTTRDQNGDWAEHHYDASGHIADKGANGKSYFGEGGAVSTMGVDPREAAITGIMSRGSGQLQQNMGDTNAFAQSRDAQLGALGNLQAQANGSAPSAAFFGNSQAMGGQASQMAGQGAGGNPLAMRAAMMGGASAMNAQAAQGANARAGEINAGMSGYGQGALGLAGNDANRAQMYAGGNLQNQDLALAQMRQNQSYGMGLAGLMSQQNAANQKLGLGNEQVSQQRNLQNAQQVEKYGVAGTQAAMMLLGGL